MEKNKCVVLLSGGMDCAVSLLSALTKYGWENTECLFFDYSKKTERLKQYAEKLCSFLNVPLTSIDVKDVYDKCNVNDMIHLRNDLFLTTGSSFAVSKGAYVLVGGFSKYDLFSDNSIDFFEEKEKQLSIGLDRRFKIEIPLFFMEKTEVLAFAKQLSKIVDFDVIECLRIYTNSDKNVDDTLNYWGFGKLDNLASIERKQAFDKAKELKII